MNARHLLLLVLLWAMVPFPTQAQVISYLPAINDSQPQVLYSLTRTLDGLEVSSSMEIDVPDRRFRALTNYFDMGGWSSARHLTGSITEMYRSDRWVSELWPAGWDPLPYGVEGLAWMHGPGRLIACAWDEEQNVTIILSIDEQTGAFEPLATLPEGLRFSGLAYSFSGLAGVTRDRQTDVSAVYVIDVEAWSVEHLVDLPAPCEALGGGDYGWVAAGERVFHVRGTEIIEWPIEPLAGKLGTIIAMGDWYGFGAVEPATWGRVKRLYR